MDNELTYRIALPVLFISFIAHRGYYSLKFKPSTENTLQQRKENFASRLANLLSVPGLIAVVVYVVYPPGMAWASLPFSAGLRWRRRLSARRIHPAPMVAAGLGQKLERQ